MIYKKWNISEYDKTLAKELMDSYGLDAFSAVLLSVRSITDKDEIEQFFSDDAPLIDPFTLPDMDIAVERITDAVENGEKIAIFGDFDADGVTATSILYDYLHGIGADVVYYIPHRIQEGYGLNIDAVTSLMQQQVSLIITVDNGISALEEVAFAKDNGVDVVITDHHMQGTLLPDAVAIVNPHRSDCDCAYRDWAGVGIAFKLICALSGDEDEMLSKYADLIAVGTIADIVPVLGENRTLIKKGLSMINASERLGIVALKAVCGVSDRALTAGDVAFTLSPRINAAGRIGSAAKAVELLTTDSPDKAIALSEEINAFNQKRVEIENQMLEQAEALLNTHDYDLDRVLVLCSEGWNSGIAGIVASKICERYAKPCIIISDTGDDVLKGSCRSISGFNIFDALSACCDCLVQFGGHTLAAGLSIQRDQVDAFREIVNDYAAHMFRYMPTASVHIDFKINPQAIDFSVIDTLQRFQPFGMCNPKPVFGIFNATVLTLTSIGGNKHTRLTLAKHDCTFSAVYFGCSTDDLPFRKGDAVDIAVNIEKNQYYAKAQISLIVKAIRYHGFSDNNLINGLRVYENFMRDETNKDEIGFIRTNRDNIAQIYRFLRDNNGWGYSFEELYMTMRPKQMNFAQLRLSLSIMIELGIIIDDDEHGRIDLPIEINKVNLPDSILYQKMLKLYEEL